MGGAEATPGRWRRVRYMLANGPLNSESRAIQLQERRSRLAWRTGCAELVTALLAGYPAHMGNAKESWSESGQVAQGALP